MSKKLLVLGFILGFCSVLRAQNTFEKVIDTLGSVGALCIQETFDGGFVYCGTSSLNGNDVMIVKLDSIGTIEWVKTYSGPGIEGAMYMEQLTDSGYMVNAVYDAGLFSKSWILRLDISGDTLWTNIFSMGGGAFHVDFGNSMSSFNHSNYGLTGYFQPVPVTHVSSCFVASDSNGLQIASKIYDTSPLGTVSYSIAASYDGGYIMAGNIGTAVGAADVYIIRTNALGDTLWTKSYGNPQQPDGAWDIKQTVDSGFILVGVTYNSLVYNVYLIKTDSVGDTLWTKSYYSVFDQVAYSVEQTSDGGYIIGGIIIDMQSGNYDVYLIKTDGLGDTLWTKQFGGNMPDNGYFVRQTKDGGYIICGVSSSFGNGGTYLIKTNSMGNVVTGAGGVEVNNPFEFSVFPNPSSGNITINLMGITDNASTLNIYNITGEKIYTNAVRIKAKEKIDIHNLPDGMYVIALQIKDRITTKKVIIYK